MSGKEKAEEGRVVQMCQQRADELIASIACLHEVLLPDINEISPESIIAAGAAINGPQNFTRVRAEKAGLRTLAEDKVLRFTPRLGREPREESPLGCRSVNRKTLFPDQQGGTVDEISAALYQQQTSRLSENMRANRGILLKIKNMGRRLARPKALPSHERLEWKCVSLPFATADIETY